MEVSQEIIERAEQTKTIEELAALAKEEHIYLTEDELEYYFKVLHPKEGEMADEELDTIGGGSQCKSGKTYSSDPPYKLIVTIGNSCELFKRNAEGSEVCNNCQHITKDGITSYCDIRTLNDDPLR